jgi:GNAT superfamily N-acetyltransferase
MDIIIYKKATNLDCKLIYDLALEIWNQHYVPIIGQDQVDYMLRTLYSESALTNQMKEGQNFTLIYSNEIPIGYFSISKKGEVSFLHKFYIDSREQSQGLGTKVMNKIITQSKGEKTIELTVNRQNFKTINFYFKNGFRIKSVEDFDIGNGYFMNDFVMEKKLD